jgi:hypothetical protein
MTVLVFIVSLKLAVTTWLMGTFVAPIEGNVDNTAGGIVSVVKDHT